MTALLSLFAISKFRVMRSLRNMFVAVDSCFNYYLDDDDDDDNEKEKKKNY